MLAVKGLEKGQTAVSSENTISFIQEAKNSDQRSKIWNVKVTTINTPLECQLLWKKGQQIRMSFFLGTAPSSFWKCNNTGHSILRQNPWIFLHCVPHFPASVLQKMVFWWCSLEIWAMWKPLLLSQWTAYLSHSPLLLIRAEGVVGTAELGIK